MTGSYRSFKPDQAFIAKLAPDAQRMLSPQAVMQPNPEPDPDRTPRRFIFNRLPSLPTDTSSSRALMPFAEPQRLIWDVNGYYRAIGFTWPFQAVSKRALMEAYRDSGGPDREYATYAFKRLLDPEFRAFYDGRPYAAPVDDKYRWLAVKKAAAMWAANETMKTGRYHDSSGFVPADIKAKMDADIRREREGDKRPAPEAHSITEWGYGYFMWDALRRDEDQLSDWQSMLLACLWERGITGRFAVGYTGFPQQAAAIRVRYQKHDVLFLHEDKPPNKELAEHVVESFLTTPLNSEFDDPIEFDLMDSDPTPQDVVDILEPCADKASGS